MRESRLSSDAATVESPNSDSAVQLFYAEPQPATLARSTVTLTSRAPRDPDHDVLYRQDNETPTAIVSKGKFRPARRNKPIAENAGTLLGSFRNTYYNFPSERDYSGPTVALRDTHCQAFAEVPRSFFETLCVQGSGQLASGKPVSFNRRDCECAEICPKTEQRICFDVLDPSKFPWGRGAAGQAITPLLTVAVDSDVIALGTPIYIPEYEGLPRDIDAKSFHNGCFIAQDRGLKVQGHHVDIFTGRQSLTELWNQLVPSNSGVTVFVNSAHCTPHSVAPQSPR